MAKSEEFEQAIIPGEEGWQKGVPGYGFPGGGGGGGYGSAPNPFIPTFSFGGQAPDGPGGPAEGVFGSSRRRRVMPGGGDQGGQLPPELVQLLMALLGGGGNGQPGQPPRMMANGGIVTRPTNAILGERGPEAVIPLGGRQPMQQGFGGGAGPFGGGMARRPGGARPMGSGPSGWSMLTNPSTMPQGMAQPQAGGGQFSMESGPMGPMGALIQNAMRGGSGSYGGLFGTNPDSGIMAGMRGRMVQDAGAQERAARLGLQARGDADPSTYGFQALMSQLQGQQGVTQGMNQAELAMRQQQNDRYWQMLSQLLGGQLGSDQTERSGRWNAAAQGGGLGQVLGGLGSLGGALVKTRR